MEELLVPHFLLALRGGHRLHARPLHGAAPGCCLSIPLMDVYLATQRQTKPQRARLDRTGLNGRSKARLEREKDLRTHRQSPLLEGAALVGHRDCFLNFRCHETWKLEVRT